MHMFKPKNMRKSSKNPPTSHRRVSPVLLSKSANSPQTTLLDYLTKPKSIWVPMFHPVEFGTSSQSWSEMGTNNSVMSIYETGRIFMARLRYAANGLCIIRAGYNVHPCTEWTLPYESTFQAILRTNFET